VTSSSCTVTVNSGGRTVTTSLVFGGRADVESARPPAVLTSELDLEGGAGRVTLDGAMVSVPAGRQDLRAAPRGGARAVDASVTQSAGRRGTWRFDLGGVQVKAGSLHVIAGTVAAITGDSVVFALSGKPGERIVFTFEVEGE
jgi:hypothetical protein